MEMQEVVMKSEQKTQNMFANWTNESISYDVIKKKNACWNFADCDIALNGAVEWEKIYFKGNFEIVLREKELLRKWEFTELKKNWEKSKQ